MKKKISEILLFLVQFAYFSLKIIKEMNASKTYKTKCYKIFDKRNI